MAGNANSGPRKQKEMRDALILALRDSPEDPPRNKMDKIVRAHIEKAMEGDMPAIKEIYDRVDGKVPQAVVGDDDHPGLFDPLTALLQAIDGKTRSV